MIRQRVPSLATFRLNALKPLVFRILHLKLQIADSCLILPASSKCPSNSVGGELAALPAVFYQSRVVLRFSLNL